MKTINFFEKINKESEQLLNQFIKHSPFGTIIVDNKQEVVYINEKMISYFYGHLDLAHAHYGNIFNCEILKETKDVCGTGKACNNCKLRTAINDVLKNNQVINNIQIKQVFITNKKQNTKWFDVSLVPLNHEEKNYVWITMIDLTDLMKFKVEAEQLFILNDEDNAIEKNRFHENVMACLASNCQSDGQAFFILTELKDTELIQEKFGYLWKNEYLSSFYKHLIDLLGPRDYACRYTSDHFLMFLPCLDFKDVEEFMKHLNRYSDRNFQAKDVLSHKVMRIRVNKESAKKSIDEEALYIKYFKALSMIESFSGEGVCEIIF